MEVEDKNDPASGHRTEADYIAQICGLADANSALRRDNRRLTVALERIAALDCGAMDCYNAISALRRDNRRLTVALERIAALDDGDATYWWQGGPMEAIKNVRNTLWLPLDIVESS